MSFDVIATENFERKLKKLAKKHRSIISDIIEIINELEDNPRLGVQLGNNCYKIRFAFTSKSKGKSGGARLITYIKIENEIVYLIDIYDKSNQETISEKELIMLIELLAD
jgi:mRNA-degrading endonuclease RelE of RelBE toxin-antitoxin system